MERFQNFLNFWIIYILYCTCGDLIFLKPATSNFFSRYYFDEFRNQLINFMLLASTDCKTVISVPVKYECVNTFKSHRRMRTTFSRHILLTFHTRCHGKYLFSFTLCGLYSSLKSMKIFVDTIFLSIHLGNRKFDYLTPYIFTKLFTWYRGFYGDVFYNFTKPSDINI